MSVCAAALSLGVLLGGCTIRTDEQLQTLIEEAQAAAAASTAVLERPDVGSYVPQDKADPGLACTGSFSPDADTGTDGFLARLLYARLFVLGTDGYPVSSVCVESSWDGTEFVMVLDECSFADGSAMTGTDVIYSLARFGYDAYVREDGSVAIRLESRDGGLPAKLSAVPLLKNGTGEETFPVCSGQYALSADGESVYERENPARVRRLVYCESRDELLLAARTGQVEYFELDSAGGEAISGADGYSVENVSTRRLHFLYFNAWNRGFTPVEGRLSVSAVIDRESMAGNGLVPAYTFVPEDCYLSSDAVVKQAKSVLEGADKQLWRNVRLLVNAENAARIARCQVIAEQLSAIGLRVTVDVRAWEDYLKALKDWDFDLAYAEIELPESYELPQLFTSEGVLNHETYKSQEADGLMQAFIESDTDARPEVFARLSARLSADSPVAPLFFEQVTAYRYDAP